MTTHTYQCKTIGCTANVFVGENFCPTCTENILNSADKCVQRTQSLSDRYPEYFKDFTDVDEADVYLIHHIFNIQDPSGCLHHSSKKILLSGVRTGGKSKFEDIKEARDTLTRWLQINASLAGT